MMLQRKMVHLRYNDVAAEDGAPPIKKSSMARSLTLLESTTTESGASYQLLVVID